MHVDQKNLEESYFPIYEDYQVKGKAAGIMCSYAFVNGVPSCGNEYMLKTKLRDAWKSDAIIQSDCCDSVSSMTDHGYVANAQEALNLAVNTGNLKIILELVREIYWILFHVVRVIA